MNFGSILVHRIFFSHLKNTYSSVSFFLPQHFFFKLATFSQNRAKLLSVKMRLTLTHELVGIILGLID